MGVWGEKCFITDKNNQSFSVGVKFLLIAEFECFFLSFWLTYPDCPLLKDVTPVLPCKLCAPVHYKEAPCVFSTFYLHTLIALTYYNSFDSTIVSLEPFCPLKSWLLFPVADLFQRYGQKQNAFLTSVMCYLQDLACIQQTENVLPLAHPTVCILNILPSNKYTFLVKPYLMVRIYYFIYHTSGFCKQKLILLVLRSVSSLHLWPNS